MRPRGGGGGNGKEGKGKTPVPSIPPIVVLAEMP